MVMSFQSEARDVSGSETPRIHHAARQRRCRMADRGARAQQGTMIHEAAGGELRALGLFE